MGGFFRNGLLGPHGVFAALDGGEALGLAGSIGGAECFGGLLGFGLEPRAFPFGLYGFLHTLAGFVTDLGARGGKIAILGAM